MSAVTDIWNTIYHIVTSADMITLAIMVVVALAAGLVMQEMTSIVTTTIVALVGFALLTYIRAIALQGQDATKLAQSDWHAFLGLQMQLVLAYAVAFAVVIGVVHAVRSAIQR